MIWRLFKSCILVGIALVITCNASGGSSSFTGLGFLPGGWDSVANAVSGNGLAVVGHSSSSNGAEAFRWTAAGGMQGLGDFVGGPFASSATSVSFDGSVVAGFGSVAPPPGCSFFCFANRAFRWTSNGGMKKLINNHSWASAISGSGHLVVGVSATGAFQWSGNGPNGLLYVDSLSGDGAAQPRGISADGSVICGSSLSNVYRPVRWVGSPVAQPLSDAAGFALAVSSDGSVIVGHAFDGQHGRAFRWNAAGGFQWLPDLLDEQTNGSATAVSGDGSVIVGHASSPQGVGAVFIWDSNNGMRNLRDVLVNEHQLDLTGWVLRDAYGISADGRTIVGWANSPNASAEAWIAHLDAPAPALPGDITSDGLVNVNDLLAVINAWGACPPQPQSCPADVAPPFDGDAVVNVNDLLMVINNWS